MRFLILLLLLCNVILCVPFEIRSQEKPIDPGSISFTILYNDVPLNESFIGDQGFSCFIEIPDHAFLFDAGRIAEHLARNTEKSGIDCSKIDFIFISHLHSDHIGGLPGIIEKCDRPLLYLPFSFPKTQTAKGRTFIVERLDRVKRYVSDVVEIKEPVKLNEYFYSTGMIEDRTYEQAFIITTTKGLMIVTGCSHPGIVEIVRRAKTFMKREVYFVMGGFHLAATDSEEVKSIATELRGLTKFIAPCHCTGEAAQETFRSVFREDYIEIKTGLTFKVVAKNENVID
ncbi:MAG: MBL fold metallo-hydrolase [Gemmatimonadota bacterium]|nr:MAG: MBL fold metallo-hydrolase [Gemmatimonadota bacterium]